MQLKIAVVAAILISGGFSLSAQTDGEPKESKMQNVAGQIYMLQGKGGNIGLCVGADGVFMIDDQFANASPEILKEIKTLSNKPIQLLVNTHHHGDHTGGNANMAAEGAVIFAHQNARNNMREPYLKEIRDAHQRKLDSVIAIYQAKLAKEGNSEENKKAVHKQAEKAIGPLEEHANIPKGELPVVAFNRNLNFYYNNEHIAAMHIPRAHTNGDVVVHFTNSNVFHMGDVFFNGRYPYIDTNNGGTLTGYIAAQAIVLGMSDEDTKIIPGHGPLGNKADLKYSLDMLEFVQQRVLYHVIAGKTEEQVVAMKNITADFDAKGYGDGFISTEKFIRMAYKEVRKNHK